MLFNFKINIGIDESVVFNMVIGNIIGFDLPVTGNPSDPSFKLGKIIWKTLEEFLIKTATAPFKAIGNLFGANPESIRQVPFEIMQDSLLNDQKNNLDALKALCILVKKSKLVNIRLHFIGGHKTEYLQMLKKYIAENELEDYVIFHGHTKDIDPLLSTMDLGLMCSRDEAFGRVTVEYMLHKIPVIASNSGANTEIVKENINGAIYTIYNANELAEKISTFVTQPELLKVMGETAYDYGKENFSSERNAALILGAIQEVVGSYSR